jgi:hypothetical protein
VGLEARVGERGVGPLAAPAREGGDVAGHEDGLGTGLAGQGAELSLGRAVAHHQSASALAQRAVEVGQRLEQELRARA